MLHAFLSGFRWLALLVGCVVLPTLLFVSRSGVAPRSFWIEFGVFLGFALLILLCLQFLLTARFEQVGRRFGTDTILLFHKHAGIWVLVFLVGHPLVLFWAKPKYWEFLDPRVNALRAIFLVLASLAMVLIAVLSVWRKIFRLKYEWWRLSHGLMSVGVLTVGLAHAWQVEHYVSGWTKRSLLVFVVGSAIGSYLYARFGRAWSARRKPYRVTGINRVLPDVSTVTLTPQGHSGIAFRGGQYAWISLDRSPFTLQQNPYSFSSSSSDSPGKLEFTVKELGDFSKRFLHVNEGDFAYIEGPYGSFCLEERVPGAVFIMGGIGITPAISIFRSLRDKQDARTLILFYGNTNRDDIAFHDELQQLARQLNLRIIFALNESEPDWGGEKGYVNRAMLEKYLPDQYEEFSYFVCGPIPMMDSVERDLLDIGVPLHRIRAERFDMV